MLWVKSHRNSKKPRSEWHQKWLVSGKGMAKDMALTLREAEV